MNLSHQIVNAESARYLVLKALHKLKGYADWRYFESVNKGRYHFAFGVKENIMIMFKREVFFNFGKEFKEQGMKGVGDGINVADLQLAIQKKIDTIYTIFPNGKIYFIALKEFLNKSYRRTVKEGKPVRYISIHEYTVLEDG